MLAKYAFWRFPYMLFECLDGCHNCSMFNASTLLHKSGASHRVALTELFHTELLHTELVHTELVYIERYSRPDDS